MHKRFIPLALAQARDGEPIDGRTRLQKMVFIVQQELDDQLRKDQRYEFFPFDYGPFSKELAEEIDAMIEEGLIDEEDEVYNEEGDLKYKYFIKSQGQSALEMEKDSDTARKVMETARHIKKRYNEELSLPEVIDEVYSEHPEYAEHSVY